MRFGGGGGGIRDWSVWRFVRAWEVEGGILVVSGFLFFFYVDGCMRCMIEVQKLD